MSKTFKLAILVSHPIQYFTPFYKEIHQQKDIDLIVYFCSRKGLEAYTDNQFGVTLKWDVPLLEGYPHKFLPNLAPTKDEKEFTQLFNPSLFKELLRDKPDLLLIHGYATLTTALAPLCCKVLGIDVGLYGDSNIDDDTSVDGPKKKLKRWLLPLYFKSYDHFFTVGHKNKEYYRHYQASEETFIDLPFSVNNQYFIEKYEQIDAGALPIPEEHTIPKAKSDIVIGFAGKFMERKRAIDLLKAFQRLHQQDLPVKLLMVGAGEKMEELQAFVRQHHMEESVVFTGFQNQSALPYYFYQMDVFVLPSMKEPWGLVLNEVMCFKTALVVTDEVGAAPDLVKDGENGYIYRAGDVDALTKQLQRMVEDRDRLAEMGEKSFAIISEWSYQKGVDNLLDAFVRQRPR